MRKKTLRHLPPGFPDGKRALVRVDYNVPLEDGSVSDPTRIEASLPTLRWLLERGARPILLSHLGRPRGEPDPAFSLAPVAPELASRLGAEVPFLGETVGTRAVEATRALAAGDVLLLENTRFLPGETENDPELAGSLAELGDFFVSDAFGSLHRAHASTAGVASHLHPAVAGLLVECELEALGTLRADAERPLVIAFGGAKISDKIDLLEAFIGRADTILVGGAMANTFFAARGNAVGRSLVEPEAFAEARDILARAGSSLRLPEDVIVTGDSADPSADARMEPADQIPADAAAMDIGPATRIAYAREVERAKTLFWNGPMGRFEDPRFAEGTFALARAAAKATRNGAFTVIGGGDSASAIRAAGLLDDVSHVSTGGGASLEFLAHGTLSGLEALDDA